MRSPPAPPLSVSTPPPPWIRSAPPPVVTVSLPGPASIVVGSDRVGVAGEAVRARERVDVQPLRARGDVDDDVAGGASELVCAAGERSHVHLVVRGAVVELRLVAAAVAAVVDVVAVAVVPDHHVVAGAAVDRLAVGGVVRASGEAVVAAAAVQRVEVRAAGDGVVVRPADDDVVAGSTVDRQPARRRGQRLIAALGRVEVDARVEARQIMLQVGAVHADGDGVVRAVAGERRGIAGHGSGHGGVRRGGQCEGSGRGHCHQSGGAAEAVRAVCGFHAAS